MVWTDPVHPLNRWRNTQSLPSNFPWNLLEKKLVSIYYFSDQISRIWWYHSDIEFLNNQKSVVTRDGSREQCGLTQYLSVIQKLHSFLCTSMVIAVSIKKNFRSVGCRRSKSSFRHYLCCPVSHERTNLA